MRRGLLLGAALAIAGCLPNPQSVKERREEFPRGDLLGELILEAPPADMEPVGAVFGGQAKLVGYTLDPAEPEPGDRVKVRFYWEALRPIDEDYQVFVHGDAIGGNAGRIHGDHYPARGNYPSDVWQEGELVVDEFVVWVPPGYGPKQLGLFTGLYKGDYRVPLTARGVKPAGRDNRSQAVTLDF